MQNATPTHTAKIPVFTGEDGQFPFYKMRFMAVVCGLGNHHHAAMEGHYPYDNMSYTDTRITLSPFKTPLKFRAKQTTASSDEDVKQEDKAQQAREAAAAQASAEAAETKENYHQISRQVFSILISSIGEEPLKRLVNAGMTQGDGIGAWKLLCKEYESGTSVNQRRLFNELINLKMEAKLAKLHDYLYAFRRITTALKGMNIELPEQLLIAILLDGLSADYRHIIDILNSMTGLTLESCMEQLKTFQSTNEIDNRQQRQDMKGYSGQQHARTTQPANKDANRRNRMMSCFNCNKTHMGGEFECKEPCRVCTSTSHVRYDCPERKRRRERNQGNALRQQARGNAAQDSALVEQFSRLLAAHTATASNNNKQHDNKQHEGNGGAVDWGINNDSPLNESERR